MALDATQLTTDIAAALNTKMIAYLATIGRSDASAFTDYHHAFAEAFAEAIVAHIVARAEVLPTGTPAMQAGGDAVTGLGKVT